MAEIGGEVEISPIKSIQNGVNREIAGIKDAFSTGMARKTLLPSEAVAQKQAEIKELSSEVRALGGNPTDKIPEQLQEKLAETRAGLQQTLQKEKDANGELPSPERTLDERFERGDMFRIMKKIWAKRSAASPEDKKVWNDRMHAALKISGDLSRNLDILNRQYHSPENLQKIPVELDGENYQIAVRHYSLGEVAKSQEPPLVLLGGATSGNNVTKSTVEAFALQNPGKDVYVIGYPDHVASVLPDNFSKKVEEEGRINLYTKLMKKTVESLPLEQFDLIGISMGGGLALGMVKDESFASRIRNLMIVSPTNIQETKGKMALMRQFVSEALHGADNPKEFLRMGRPQTKSELQPNQLGKFIASADAVRQKEFTADDLAQIQVNGRILVITGEKDRIISAQQTLQEVGAANGKRAIEGKKLIEPCLIKNAHHNVGDAYAAGIVRLIRETDSNSLPPEYKMSQLENSTAKVMVKKDPLLAPIADQILKNNSY